MFFLEVEAVRVVVVIVGKIVHVALGIRIIDDNGCGTGFRLAGAEKFLSPTTWRADNELTPLF